MTLRTLSHPAARTIETMLQAEMKRLVALGCRTSVRSDPGLNDRLERAIRAATGPVCAESQADGVPCKSVLKACDQCTEALEFVRRACGDLEAEAKRREAELGARMAGWGGDLP